MSTGVPDFLGKGTPVLPTRVDTYSVEEAGIPLNPPEEGKKKAGGLGDYVKPQPEIVIVRVREDGDKYALLVHQGDHEILHAKADEPPGPMLPVDKSARPTTVRSSMKTFSEKHKPVSKLFKQIAKLKDELKHDDIYLVIVDHTTFGLPWEMTWGKIGKIERRLGGLVTTVHVSPDDDDEDLCQDLRPKSEPAAAGACTGQLTLLVSTDVRDENQERVDKHVKSMEARARVAESEFKNLAYYLKNTPGGVGLLYLLCHGFADKDNLNDSWLGTETDEANGGTRVTYELLNNLGQMDLFDDSPSIVFINACEVGSVVATDPSVGIGPLGFATMFLGQGARGVIGALHKVDVRHAVQLAEMLLDLAWERPYEPVPKLIRRLRERADEEVEAALRTPDQARWAHAFEKWYYTYLYVYYGDPWATLKLDEPEVDP